MTDTTNHAEALTRARVDIAALEVQVASMSTQLAELTRTVNALRDQLTEAKGGWRALMLLGGASATLGGVVTTVLQHFKGS